MALKDFLARLGRPKTIKDEATEQERDVRFAARLEKTPAFKARPEFQADLRSRLQVQLAEQNAPASVPRQFGQRIFFRLASAGIGLVAVLIFGLALLDIPINKVATPTSFALAPSVIPAQTDESLSYIYDSPSSSYVNLQDASNTLGFTPLLPAALPPEYKLENIALAYGENLTPNRPKSNVGPLTPGGDTTKPYGFQFQLSSENKEAIQVYQLAAPFGAFSGPRFNVSGAQKYNPQTIRGLPGYLIQGGNWRMNFVPPPPPNRAQPPFTPPSRLPQSPPANGNQPGGPPFGGKRPPMMPPSDMGMRARIAFGQMLENNNSGRFRPYIDFQPRADGKSARSLVWQKDNLLIVLVGSDVFPEPELKRLAESFK